MSECVLLHLKESNEGKLVKGGAHLVAALCLTSMGVLRTMSALSISGLDLFVIFFDDSNRAFSIMVMLMVCIEDDDQMFFGIKLSRGVKLTIGWLVVLSPSLDS